MLYLFGACGILIGIVLGTVYVLAGELTVLNVNFAAYGYILMGIGFIISLLMKKQENFNDLLDHVKYIMDKRNKELLEEVKKLRLLVLDLEAKRGRRGGEADGDGSM